MTAEPPATLFTEFPSITSEPSRTPKIADMYDATFGPAKFLAQFRRPYEAAAYEPCFAGSGDLRAGERLERRTGLFRFPNGDKVRLDRIYRLSDTEADFELSPTETPESVRPLDEGGGALLWSAAMFAGHVLVQCKADVAREKAEAILAPGYSLEPTLSALCRGSFPSDAEDEFALEAALSYYNSLDLVAFAEPNFVVVPQSDPLTAQQWHLTKTGAITNPFGGSTTLSELNSHVVGIVDTGFDNTHVDLAANVWSNPGALGTNPTDQWGWNFISNNNNPTDNNGHGTHIAGIVGAIVDNDHGGRGVATSVKMMSIRAVNLDANGNVSGTDKVENAIRYIMGINGHQQVVSVLNLSFAFSAFSDAVYSALANIVPINPVPPTVNVVGAVQAGKNKFTVQTLSDISKIKPGMSFTGGTFPANTLVLTTNATTGLVTMAKNATTNNNTATLAF
ncbi:MAG TPA: S8 family serine peptidase, partial [Chthoniobacteraceae bacterium]|nr:S8 family serine peptidase [Chthoniobacteraceae bacterium]